MPYRAALPLIVVACSLATPHAAEPTPEMLETLEEYRRLADLTRLVQREYVEPIAREQLWAGAVDGMLRRLDPASRYLTERELLLRAESGSDHVGFGFDWHHQPERDAIVVLRVLVDGPADRAGVVRGDTILDIDGRSVTDRSLQEIRDHLLAADDRLDLRLRHADGTVVEARIERAPLTDDGVAHASMIDETWKLGLVRLDRLVADPDEADTEAPRGTASAFRAALDRLADRGLRGLVLDLRGNPGGSLAAAVAIADAFLDARPGDGTLIVRQESRNPAHQAVHRASSSTTYPRWPLVVLVDAGTASGAEIIAGALGDHQRALLLGTPTAGKNTVQQRFLLDDGAAVQLTVARFRIPNGSDLSGSGLQPDVVLPTTAATWLALARARGTADAPPANDPALTRAREILMGTLLHQAGRGF